MSPIKVSSICPKCGTTVIWEIRPSYHSNEIMTAYDYSTQVQYAYLKPGQKSGIVHINLICKKCEEEFTDTYNLYNT